MLTPFTAKDTPGAQLTELVEYVPLIKFKMKGIKLRIPRMPTIHPTIVQAFSLLWKFMRSRCPRRFQAQVLPLMPNQIPISKFNIAMVPKASHEYAVVVPPPIIAPTKPANRVAKVVAN